jgi:hypothetical protein
MLTIHYQELKTKGLALKQLYGFDAVYIEGVPFSLATSCEPGGSHRLDMATSVWFYGTDPDSGVRMRWSFDIESPSANGSSSYAIDADACRNVMRELRGEARDQFRAYLADCAAKVRARGEEYRKAADKQAMDAAILSDLASTAA